jgi:hypothetical protein
MLMPPTMSTKTTGQDEFQMSRSRIIGDRDQCNDDHATQRPRGESSSPIIAAA